MAVLLCLLEKFQKLTDKTAERSFLPVSSLSQSNGWHGDIPYCFALNIPSFSLTFTCLD